jgi:hypothetical protein
LTQNTLKQNENQCLSEHIQEHNLSVVEAEYKENLLERDKLIKVLKEDIRIKSGQLKKLSDELDKLNSEKKSLEPGKMMSLAKLIIQVYGKPNDLSDLIVQSQVAGMPMVSLKSRSKNSKK